MKSQDATAKPQIIRDKKGRIIKGIAQDTNKNGTAGRPCEYCRDKEKIDKITTDFLQEARDSRKTSKPLVPYLQDLADRLDCDAETIIGWAEKKENDNLEHPDYYRIIKRLTNLKELQLLERTLGRFNPTGAIFQLKTKHGYIETEKKLLASDSNEPLKIIITEEQNVDPSE